MADAVLAAIQTQIARGMDPQAALDAFAPVSSEANRIDRYLADYLAEQEDRELRRCAAREEGLFSWWFGASIYEIDAKALADWRRWLSHERGSLRSRCGMSRAISARS